MNQSKQNLRTELEEWLRFETLLTEISASFITQIMHRTIIWAYGLVHKILCTLRPE